DEHPRILVGFVIATMPPSRYGFVHGTPSLSSIEPTEHGDQMERRQEVPGRLVIACRDGPELFDPAEGILDQVPRLVSRLVMRPPVLAIALRWDNGGFARRLQ